MDGIQFFDRQQEFSIVYKSLPHWAQGGTICFITWRTADSLPRNVLERLEAERKRLLLSAGLNQLGDWRCELAKLSPKQQTKLRGSLFAAWDLELDRCAGECVLKRPEFSEIVYDSLLHFDGERYLMTDFVVMPNHVHCLVAFRGDETMLRQCTSWKRFTAIEIQKRLNRHGQFWQVEQFDHLVRSAEQFAYYRRYIAGNPTHAGLQAGAYRWYSKEL